MNTPDITGHMQKEWIHYKNSSAYLFRYMLATKMLLSVAVSQMGSKWNISFADGDRQLKKKKKEKGRSSHRCAVAGCHVDVWLVQDKPKKAAMTHFYRQNLHHYYISCMRERCITKWFIEKLKGVRGTEAWRHHMKEHRMGRLWIRCQREIMRIIIKFKEFDF